MTLIKCPLQLLIYPRKLETQHLRFVSLNLMFNQGKLILVKYTNLHSQSQSSKAKKYKAVTKRIPIHKK